MSLTEGLRDREPNMEVAGSCCFRPVENGETGCMGLWKKVPVGKGLVKGPGKMGSLRRSGRWT